MNIKINITWVKVNTGKYNTWTGKYNTGTGKLTHEQVHITQAEVNITQVQLDTILAQLNNKWIYLEPSCYLFLSYQILYYLLSHLDLLCNKTKTLYLLIKKCFQLKLTICGHNIMCFSRNNIIKCKTKCAALFILGNCQFSQSQKNSISSKLHQS